MEGIWKMETAPLSLFSMDTSIWINLFAQKISIIYYFNVKIFTDMIFATTLVFKKNHFAILI